MNLEQTKEAVAKRDGLKCSITEKPVTSLDDLRLHKVKDLHIEYLNDANEEVFNPDNYILVSNGLRPTNTKRLKVLEAELEKRINELETQEKSNYERDRVYREQIEQQRRELEILRANLISEQRSRDSRLHEESEYQAATFRKKESALIEHIEEERRKLQEQTIALEEEKSKLELKLAEHHSKISSDYAELEREKEKYKEETRKNIERRSGEYVNDSLKSLDAATTKYHSISRNWSIAGFLSLILGVATGIFFGTKGLSPAEGKDVVEWSQVVFYAFKGIIVIGLFVALSKYCFMYGQSFMHESIKNGERKHAINFGKFYLQSYGVDAQWSQVKEAFEHWNINSASAFSGHDPDKFDPKMMDKALQFVESFQKLSKSKKAENDSTA